MASTMTPKISPNKMGLFGRNELSAKRAAPCAYPMPESPSKLQPTPAKLKKAKLPSGYIANARLDAVDTQ